MSTVAPAQRLLNLIIALTQARVRMTRADIRNSVEGYDPIDYSLSESEAKKKDAAFERMFERDKDDLRRMGVPIKTVTDAAHGNDIGYKIDAHDAALPLLDFTPGERAVLGLAAEYWQNATLGADARQALTKVSSTTLYRPAVALPFAARSTASQDVTAALIEAIGDRQALTFEYSSATSGTSQRRVDPWRLMLRGGTEYLIGMDLDREAPRTFRIGRIHGKVRLEGEPGAYDPPQELPAGAWTVPAQGGQALIAVRPEAGHSLRARGSVVRTDGDWDVVAVDYDHADSVRDEVLRLSGAARVLEPSSIRDAVIEHATRALEVSRG